MRQSAVITLSLICLAAPSGGLTQAPSTYVLKKDDTLLTVAEKLRPKEATMNQMALALFRTNLGTFQSKNTLELPAGTKLNVPPAEAVLGTDADNAHQEFDRIWRSDQHYRAAVALEKSKDMFYAFVSYVEAAKLGSGRAQLRLAQLYDNDRSGFIRHDLQESAEWYEKARLNQVQFATQSSRTPAYHAW